MGASSHGAGGFCRRTGCIGCIWLHLAAFGFIGLLSLSGPRGRLISIIGDGRLQCNSILSYTPCRGSGLSRGAGGGLVLLRRQGAIRGWTGSPRAAGGAATMQPRCIKMRPKCDQNPARMQQNAATMRPECDHYAQARAGGFSRVSGPPPALRRRKAVPPPLRGGGGSGARLLCPSVPGGGERHKGRPYASPHAGLSGPTL